MYKDKKVVHIVARGLNGEIGKDNELMWSIPEELKYFRAQTLGHVVLMGRKTFESLPKKLERRCVSVVSSNLSKGVPIVSALDDSVDYSTMLNTDCIFIVGGGQLYEATENIVDELLITEVDKEYPDADTFYKQPDGFELTNKSEWMEDFDRLSGDVIRYCFTTYCRLPF